MNKFHTYNIGDCVKIITKNRNNIGYIERRYKKNAKVRLAETYKEINVLYSDMEYIPPVVLSTTELKKIVRNEINFFDLFGKINDFDNFKVEGEYDISLADFRVALTKYKENMCTLGDISNWFSVLTDELEEIFDIYDIYNINVKESAYSEKHALCYALSLMHDELFNEALELIDLYYEDINKHYTVKRYPTEYKKDFVRAYDDDNSLKLATNEQIALFRMFAQNLCETDDIDGLRAVGYGCYCGNRAFIQDWNVARDCLTKLYEKVDTMPDKAFYANTLGYIYYYGRCNNGIPQYEEAYKYFSFGAFNRIYESQYKIADMYRNGYGVVKSPETANCIIRQLYDENTGYILTGNFESKYADIALRMVDTYKYDDYSDLDEMLSYCTKAEFAIRMRMSVTDYYGDSKVCASIKKRLEEIKNELNFKPLKKVTYYSLAGLFAELLSNGMKLKMTVCELKNNKYKLTFSNYRKDNRKLFITVPDVEICGLYDKFSVIAKPEKSFDLIKFGKEIVFDGCYYDTLEFDRNTVFNFGECEYIIKATNKTHKEYRVASVCFSNGGKTYDYLCDSTVNEGDEVIVETYNGEETVKVVRIKICRENELTLPLKKYKHILQKL